MYSPGLEAFSFVVSLTSVIFAGGRAPSLQGDSAIAAGDQLIEDLSQLFATVNKEAEAKVFLLPKDWGMEFGFIGLQRAGILVARSKVYCIPLPQPLRPPVSGPGV